MTTASKAKKGEYKGYPIRDYPFAPALAWRLIPRECFRNLACKPFRVWVCGDIDPDKLSTPQPNNHEGIEQLEPIAGTTNVSMAAMSHAWLRKNVRKL